MSLLLFLTPVTDKKSLYTLPYRPAKKPRRTNRQKRKNADPRFKKARHPHLKFKSDRTMSDGTSDILQGAVQCNGRFVIPVPLIRNHFAVTLPAPGTRGSNTADRPLVLLFALSPAHLQQQIHSHRAQGRAASDG